MALILASSRNESFRRVSAADDLNKSVQSSRIGLSKGAKMEAHAIEKTPLKKARKRLSVIEKLAKIEERQKALAREKKKLAAIDAKQQADRDRRIYEETGYCIRRAIDAGKCDAALITRLVAEFGRPEFRNLMTTQAALDEPACNRKSFTSIEALMEDLNADD